MHYSYNKPKYAAFAFITYTPTVILDLVK